MNKTVTVVIPTYKRPDRIERAVLSVLQQTWTPVEIIVVDDNGMGSEEQKKTQAVLSTLITEGKMQYLCNEKNSGGSVSRNNGLKIAKGEYITFLDDDDELHPTKLQKQIETLEEKGDAYSACYTGYHKLTEDGKVYASRETVEGDVYLQALARSIYVGSGSNLLVRTNRARAIGGYDESFKRNQDLEFLTRIVKGHKLAYVDEDLMTIHYEIREVKRSYESMIATDEHYFSTFRKDIEVLSAEQQHTIYSICALERFRYALPRKQLRDAVVNMGRNHVRFTEFVRYIAYLVDRTTHKTSYGFKG